MKREREHHYHQVGSINMANCLMLLSRGSSSNGGDTLEYFFSTSSSTVSSGRVFECKTCKRQFPSFQALGGHRASHKKPRLMDGAADQDGGSSSSNSDRSSSPVKPKTHECSICGLEFAIGQALGGHMRRHRTTIISSTSSPLSLSNYIARDLVHVDQKKMSKNRVNGGDGGGAISTLCLDLNLTPSENDSKFLQLGNNTISTVDCCL